MRGPFDFVAGVLRTSFSRPDWGESKLKRRSHKSGVNKEELVVFELFSLTLLGDLKGEKRYLHSCAA